MPHWIRAIPGIARVAVAGMFAYRAEMVIWILTATMPLVMLGLWNAVVQEGSLAGFGPDETARYFTITLLVRQLTGAWIFWQLSYDIRSGGLSAKLLRPFHPLVPEAIWTLAALPIRFVILAPMLLALFAWKPTLWSTPDLAHVLLFLPSVFMAWLLSFLVQSIFGTLAFWFDKSEGMFGLWFSVWSLASGYVAPLAFFPAGWGDALRWMPFYGTMALPVEILGGFAPMSELVPLVGVQLFWTGVLLWATRATWNSGVRRYGAFGA